MTQPGQSKGGVHRLSRRYEVLDSLDLFARIQGQVKDGALNDPSRIEDFLSIVKGGLEKALATESTLHGSRVESLFEHLAPALGNVQLLKSEDAGECIYLGEKPKIPDFRLVPVQGDPFLVEVKNVHQPPNNVFKDFSISEGELSGLRRYRDLAAPSWPIKFAVYWSKWNQWTLVPDQSFVTTKGRATLSVIDAFKNNEMVDLGDVMLATLPPLAVTFVADKNANRTVDPTGNAQFTIADVQVTCADEIIRSPAERSLAMMLMLYGSWEEDTAVELENGLLDRVTFSFAPPADAETNGADQPFRVVGQLSSIYSAAFNQSTVGAEGVKALNVGDSSLPRVGTMIPVDYEGRDLPIWRFKVQPQDHRES